MRDWPRAAPYMKLAGDRAAAAGDADLAARHYGRALQALQHLDELHELEQPELKTLAMSHDPVSCGSARQQGVSQRPVINSDDQFSAICLYLWRARAGRAISWLCGRAL